MKLQHIQLPDYNIIVSDEEIKDGDKILALRRTTGKLQFGIMSKRRTNESYLIPESGDGFYCNKPQKAIASTNPEHNLSSIGYTQSITKNGITKTAGQWLGVDAWSLGNRISVQTLYDYEERKPFPNHNEYENLGKETYIGEVIEVDKGLALKTDDGKIFKTQGTYWFGSILQQDIKLIKKARSVNDKKFSLEDMGNLWDFCTYNKGNFNEYIQSLQKPKINNIGVKNIWINRKRNQQNRDYQIEVTKIL